VQRRGQPQQPGHEGRDPAPAGEGQRAGEQKCLRGLQIINIQYPRVQELNSIGRPRFQKRVLNYITTAEVAQGEGRGDRSHHPQNKKCTSHITQYFDEFDQRMGKLQDRVENLEKKPITVAAEKEEAEIR
jgi:hypothetical protein